MPPLALHNIEKMSYFEYKTKLKSKKHKKESSSRRIVNLRNDVTLKKFEKNEPHQLMCALVSSSFATGNLC